MAARHVLVPLGVAGLALAVLLWRDSQEAVVPLTDDVTACAANLRGGIYMALQRERMLAKRLPQAAGPAVLGALLASGALEDPSALACPGPRAEPRLPLGPGDAVTSAHTGYAVRDLVAFPLAAFPSGGSRLEPLAACDNARGLNHDGCTNVLYSDGSVVTLTLAHEIESGRLPAGATTIPVGPDAPNPDLAKLVP